MSVFGEKLYNLNSFCVSYPSVSLFLGNIASVVVRLQISRRQNVAPARIIMSLATMINWCSEDFLFLKFLLFFKTFLLLLLLLDLLLKFFSWWFCGEFFILIICPRSFVRRITRVSCSFSTFPVLFCLLFIFLPLEGEYTFGYKL